MTVARRTAIWLVMALALAAPPAVHAAARLSSKHIQIVEATANAWLRGQPTIALAQLAPLVGALDQERLLLVDEALAKRQLPSAGKLLAEARLSLAQQNLADKAPPPTAGEARLLLPALRDKVLDELSRRDGHPAMSDPLPERSTIRGYEDLLWQVHVLNNQLEVARRLAEYTAFVAASIPPQMVAKLSDADRKIVEEDYRDLVTQADEAIAELGERGVELRVRRLQLAVAVLEDPVLTQERFLAAYAWNVDRQLIDAFYKKKEQQEPPVFLRDSLAALGMKAQIAADADRAKELAGDLTEKAHLLFQGLHWWTRGRYGRGPEVFGLAKTKAALRFPQAQLWLFMPEEPPDPTSLAGGGYPYYDRRHHYTWAWEDGRVQRSSKSYTRTNREGVFW
jgi:hypothetical protein